MQEQEEPLPNLTGRAWAFGIGISATDILPTRHAGESPLIARRHLFADLDSTLAARIAPGDVIVAEEQDGSDTSAPPALAALRAAGVVAITARRFAAAVEDAALAAGIVPIVLDAPSTIRTGNRLRIDLEDAKVVNLSSGDRAPIRNLSEERRRALRALFR